MARLPTNPPRARKEAIATATSTRAASLDNEVEAVAPDRPCPAPFSAPHPHRRGSRGRDHPAAGRIKPLTSANAYDERRDRPAATTLDEVLAELVNSRVTTGVRAEHCRAWVTTAV